MARSRRSEGVRRSPAPYLVQKRDILADRIAGGIVRQHLVPNMCSGKFFPLYDIFLPYRDSIWWIRCTVYVDASLRFNDYMSPENVFVHLYYRNQYLSTSSMPGSAPRSGTRLESYPLPGL